MVYPDSHTASFSFILFFPVFMRSVFLCGAYFCAERSPVLCWAGGAGEEALGKEVLGQGALRQEALLWFLQSPGVPYVISL